MTPSLSKKLLTVALVDPPSAVKFAVPSDNVGPGTLTAGLLAGLAGTSMLEIHCPNLDAWHILLSHLGVAILCALAGLAIGLTAEIRGTRSILHNNPEYGALSEPF